MIVQNKGGKGNPYHDNESGEFTSGDFASAASGDLTKNFLSEKSSGDDNFDEEFDAFLDNFDKEFDSFLDSFDFTENTQEENFTDTLAKAGCNYLYAKDFNKDFNKFGNEEKKKLWVGINTLRYVKIGNYSGACEGNTIQLSFHGTGVLDKENGYTTPICTFTHETGHSLDFSKKISTREDVIDAAIKSRLELINNLARAGGVATEITTVDRIPQTIKDAVWSGLKKIVYGDLANSTLPSFSDYGGVTNPENNYKYHVLEQYKTEDEYVERKMKNFYSNDWEYGLNPTLDSVANGLRSDYKKIYQNFVDEMKRYKQAEESGVNKMAMEKYKEAQSVYDNNRQKSRILQRQFGIVTDFLGISTKGRFDVIKGSGAHYWGHGKSYIDHDEFSRDRNGRSAQSEFWAEFYRAKLMGDETSLKAAKDLMPTLYNKMEEIYNNL